VEGTSLLIFACSAPGEAGKTFFFHGEGPFEVVRPVEEEEVASLHPAFFWTVKNSVPPDTALHWVECRKTEGCASATRDIALFQRQRWTVHGVPLHVIAWAFDSVDQAKAFRAKTFDEVDTAEALQAGCFYYILLTLSEWHVGIFLSCDDIAEETREGIAQIASENGILQLVPPPEDAVRTAIARFDNLPPGVTIRENLENDDLPF